jgi:cell division protein FtsN
MIYFEVGSFKDIIWAEHASEALTQQGFSTLLIHKSLLWMDSYQVLVGPYGTGDDTASVRKQLTERGFKPRLKIEK